MGKENAKEKRPYNQRLACHRSDQAHGLRAKGDHRPRHTRNQHGFNHGHMLVLLKNHEEKRNIMKKTIKKITTPMMVLLGGGGGGGGGRNGGGEGIANGIGLGLPKRGPKPKPAGTHHQHRHYRHAPDVIKILDELPKGQRSKFVDDAIRLLSRKRALQKVKGLD